MRIRTHSHATAKRQGRHYTPFPPSRGTQVNDSVQAAFAKNMRTGLKLLKLGYIVTNLEGEARALYEDLYCARGEMENRIKEAQLGLFADRTSCHYFAANQFRLLLSSLAYILNERLRTLALSGTEFARLQASTLRVKLLKIGAVILRNTRRVRVLLSSAFPHQAIFLAAARALDSP